MYELETVDILFIFINIYIYIYIYLINFLSIYTKPFNETFSTRTVCTKKSFLNRNYNFGVLSYYLSTNIVSN